MIDKDQREEEEALIGRKEKKGLKKRCIVVGLGKEEKDKKEERK